MDKKSFFLLVGVIILFFIIPYFWRKYKGENIKENALYTMGIVTRMTGSLKNGNSWHYKFLYNNKEYEDYKPTHVDYEVHVGNYFLVMFSSEKPDYSSLLYDKRIIDNAHSYYGVSWDTIPYFLLDMRRK